MDSYKDIVDDHKKYMFFVDNYCKISHIIDNKNEIKAADNNNTVDFLKFLNIF